ncbi:Paired amphipathic helix [Arabidopsis suecica]|uniref:Paired amphipathic helix (PAH2) superfamily protein n=5 Tax=Arabidopsis TaxID=3701 RepID=Q1G3L8_ARATH|nr:Paired amphipathic helix (PAH2) superfamily protein [Arabidopsis thaliana]ABF59366.1 unknown protein [Arabidopsis thaliana]AEE76856.1 Paired amphipathic helix (PAH2) superfamily protein [Arabidopsis thaliana]KAG7632378.1 Paired amphipathic helix [Arabidopsis suecica]CAD5323988.1 unnamed protein product [Arabidopsis thaliana]|eukprot:NP_001030755.1 Paired amphipathic helix (PAH2) superfamily protein [Arabidopsis thaliana]
MIMHTTNKYPIKLPNDCSQKEFKRALEFVKKVKEIDEKGNHRGIFLRYTTAMKLYYSGSLSEVDLKNRITTIFKNCDVLLDAFDRFLEDSNSSSRQKEVFVDPKNVKRIKEFLKSLRRDCEELCGVLIEAFVRFKEHNDVQILKDDVDLMLRDYPRLKEEFRMILLDHGLIQDEKRDEMTRGEEDELFKDDMYFHAIESAIKFAVAEDNEKPEVGVYGAIRRFYKQRRRKLPRGIMKDPKLGVRRILPNLQRKYNELLKNRTKSLEKVRKVNESLVVFDWVR